MANPTSATSAEAARFWTPRHLAAVTAGRWLAEPQDLDRPLAGLSIDTRTLGRDDVFLAIKGPRFDGHNFLDAAAQAGAAMAIVETTATSNQPSAVSHAFPLLHVDNAVAALHALAHAWRDVLQAAGCRVIAVAGSNGKTTTRHLIHAALQGSDVSRSPERTTSDHSKPETRNSKLTGTQSPRSFNNHLGVPLTLLAARAEHDFVVAEIGTNHPGEVATLAAIARPDAAVITSVGREHLEHFGSLDAVAREEGSLLEHVAPQGIAVVEADAWRHITAVLTPPAHLHVIRFGATPDADLHYTDLTETPLGLTFEAITSPIAHRPSHIPLTLPLLGRHNASNTLAAVAVGQWMGVSLDQLAAHLAAVDAVPGRLEVRRLGTLLVLHDAYNANPDSMVAALEALAGLSVSSSEFQVSSSPEQTRNAKRRIAILGDMGELGAHGPDAHRQLGDDIAAHGDAIDRVLLVGRLTLFTAEALARHWPSESERVQVIGPLDDDALDRIAGLLAPNDIVLLKASRTVALERLLPVLEKRFTQ
ncbi:MAG: UDP-N-acetylmuramoyl-tripeptide--D-alanyl-D-alanine ligase [Phycisphaeraceae bacterium]